MARPIKIRVHGHVYVLAGRNYDTVTPGVTLYDFEWEANRSTVDGSTGGGLYGWIALKKSPGAEMKLKRLVKSLGNSIRGVLPDPPRLSRNKLFYYTMVVGIGEGNDESADRKILDRVIDVIRSVMGKAEPNENLSDILDALTPAQQKAKASRDVARAKAFSTSGPKKGDFLIDPSRPNADVRMLFPVSKSSGGWFVVCQDKSLQYVQYEAKGWTIRGMPDTAKSMTKTQVTGLVKGSDVYRNKFMQWMRGKKIEDEQDAQHLKPEFTFAENHATLILRDGFFQVHLWHADGTFALWYRGLHSSNSEVVKDAKTAAYKFLTTAWLIGIRGIIM